MASLDYFHFQSVSRIGVVMFHNSEHGVILSCFIADDSVHWATDYVPVTHVDGDPLYGPVSLEDDALLAIAQFDRPTLLSSPGFVTMWRFLESVCHAMYHERLGVVDGKLVKGKEFSSVSSSVHGDYHLNIVNDLIDGKADALFTLHY